MNTRSNNKFIARHTVTITALMVGLILLMTGCPEQNKRTKSTTSNPNSGSRQTHSINTAQNKPNQQKTAQSKRKKIKTARIDSDASDEQLISAIRNLGGRCNLEAFRGNKTHQAVLNYEWLKIEERVQQLYKKRFPNRPKPSGSFVIAPGWLRAQGFFSHNKHYEFLVAKALAGSDRQHIKFRPRAMATPFRPPRLKTEFFFEGTTQPNFENIANAVAEAFERDGHSVAKITPRNDRKKCKVESDWKTLQRIGGVTYQYCIRNSVREFRGVIVAADRVFKSDASRLQFETYVIVRETGGEEIAKLGPMRCTLFEMGNQRMEFRSAINNWHAVQAEKLRGSQLPEDTFGSTPTLQFNQKVSGSWKRCDFYDSIGQLQGTIVDRVKQ